MTLDEWKKNLQEPIPVPDILQKKLQDAFRQIRSDEAHSRFAAAEAGTEEGAETQSRKPEPLSAISEDTKPKEVSMHKKTFKRSFVLSLAATLATGAICAAAFAYRSWSQNILHGMKTDEETLTLLEEEGMLSVSGSSATCNGITISAEEMIVDPYYALVTLKIKGYYPPEGHQPCFYKEIYTIGDEITYWGGYQQPYNPDNPMSSFRIKLIPIFYRDVEQLYRNKDGVLCMEDGSPAEYTEDGRLITDKRMEGWDSGELTYVLHITCRDMEDYGFFKEKTLRISFDDLGYWSDQPMAQYTEDKSGKGHWELSVTLPGIDEMREEDLHRQPLGKTGAVFQSIQISPISMTAVIDTSQLQEGRPVYAVKNQLLDDLYAIVSWPGLKMTDGTFIQSICAGSPRLIKVKGSENLYQTTIEFDRIINPDDVAAILYYKNFDSGIRQAPRGPYSEDEYLSITLPEKP